MDKYFKKGTENTPAINFDPDLGQLEISGKSIPEDSLGFYEPIMDWLREYVDNPRPTTTFSFKLEYFNTSSSKVLLDIFYILEEIEEGLILNWYCEDSDEDMEETASDFNEVLENEIQIIKY